MFDKILDKLGIYDLMSVLLTGTIITFITLRIAPVWGFDFKIETNDTLQFLIISYFIGVVFQEIGSILKSKKLLEIVFKESNDLHISLSQKESNYIINYVCKKIDTISDDDFFAIYNYCKRQYFKDNNNTDIDKKQSIAGMGRSLFFYFLLLSIVSFFTYFKTSNIVLFFVCIVSSILMMVFYRRYVRFIKMRYVSIMRAFYYTYNEKED